jgi:hypothetical protein
MGLSEDLISQFAKVTNDSKEDDKETTVYGTVVKYEGRDYVKLDGSELLTPISSTAVADDGERVTVMIKNHTATITGNISSPAARNGDVSDISDQITEFEIIISDRVVADDIEAVNGYFESIKSTIANFSDMEAVTAQIETLQAKYASLDHVTATDIEAINADIESLKATFGDFTNISADDLEAINADFDNVKAYNAKFTYVSADVLKALKAEVVRLDTEKLSATDAEIKYANIDFANIDQAAITKLFTDSGIIKDLIVSEGKITGELVGVTIKGDIIEGGTVKADKLVVKGSDGLFYKLNVDGADGVTAEQTEYNSLNGSVITAKSVTAEKIAVDDLVAFDATIGGFVISDAAIYSGVKSSADNTTRGIYMDKDGQWVVGDASNFIKYYRDTDGSYKLAISARSIKLSTSGVDLETAVADAITSSVEEFYLSTSPTSLSGGSWSTSQPAWTQGKYIWRRTAVTYGDGSSEYTPDQNGVCITGNTGDKGEQGIQGPQGVSGKTSYFHIKYSSVSNPTTSSQMTETPSTYIGTYVDFVETDSTDPNKYSWTQFKGSQGAKGDQGIPGTNGTNGQTSYLHIAYATNATGTAGFSTTDGTGKAYIGQYTDFTLADSTDPSKYTWTLIKGATGATGPQGPTGQTGAPGADAITMVVTSTNGTVFKNTAIATTLQAHVYKAGVEVTGTALSSLGTIKWYKDGSTTASATGSTLTISAGSVDNKATYEARLE